MFPGCNFRPRYDTFPPDANQIEHVHGPVGAVEIYIKALTKQIYVCDVCTKCGQAYFAEG